MMLISDVLYGIIQVPGEIEVLVAEAISLVKEISKQSKAVVASLCTL